MSKLTEKFIDIGLNSLNDVDIGEGQFPPKAILSYNDVTEKFELRPLGQLTPLSRVINQNLTIEESEFLILKCPKINRGVRLKVEGQLKVV
jgi:hypothetical protein